jgi:glycosyltransferase involved in cell wall biosynthesis
MKKLISIVTPTYNEFENLDELLCRVKKVTKQHPKYDFEHIFIDNNSTDGTIEKLKDFAETDKNVKVILNTRNFGHLRSPYYGIITANGDAVILLTGDLQDPPEKISDFIERWEEGYKSVMAVKETSKESALLFFLRKQYYKFLDIMSEVPQIRNATGAGLYDKVVIDKLRLIEDPYPYFRGLIAELGYPVARVKFDQPKRKKGITKNNVVTLYDLAILGFTKHSRIPLRLMAIIGGLLAALSLLISLVIFIFKLFFWSTFDAGIAPLMIGMFFLGGIQMFFIGVLGEYIGNIHTQVRNMPLVVESERINQLEPRRNHLGN